MNPTIQDEIMVLTNIPDDQIDTSDIPEVIGWEKVQVGRFYRKTNTITIQVDSDVLSWLESQNDQNKIKTKSMIFYVTLCYNNLNANFFRL